MDYIFLTDEEKHDRIAQAMLDREREHFAYELNRLNYEEILKTFKDLPDEWPEEIAKFKGLGSEQLAQALHGDDYDLAVQYQLRDRMRHLHKTTCCEQAKGCKVYDALLVQLPEGKNRDDAVQRCKDREAAKKAKEEA